MFNSSANWPITKIFKLYLQCHMCDYRLSALSGCVGRKSPHVQETQVEAGRSWEASDHFLGGGVWMQTDKKLMSVCSNDAWWMFLWTAGPIQ